MRKEFSIKALDAGQLDLMFNYLKMGHQKPNVPALKENLEAIRQAMIQKTGGNRPDDPPYYTDHDDIASTSTVLLSRQCVCIFRVRWTGWRSCNDGVSVVQAAWYLYRLSL